MIGAWHNFDHLEESLTLEELYVLANTQGLREHRIIRKLGAIQGVDIPDIEEESEEETQKDFRDRIEERLRNERGVGMADPAKMQGTGYQQI